MVPPLWKTLWRTFQKLEKWNSLLYDPAILHLGIYLKALKERSQRVIFALMFNRALCTTAKRRKQPKCPSTTERIKEMSYIHITKYCAALKEKKIPSQLQYEQTSSTLCYVK